MDFFTVARDITAPRRTQDVTLAAHRHLAKAMAAVHPRDRARLLVEIIDGAANALGIIDGPDHPEVQSAKLMAAILKDFHP